MYERNRLNKDERVSDPKWEKLYFKHSIKLTEVCWQKYHLQHIYCVQGKVINEKFEYQGLVKIIIKNLIKTKYLFYILPR